MTDTVSDTLLLSVTSNFSVRVGFPPKHLQDGYMKKSSILGKVKKVSCIACSPDGELFCIRSGDLYRGPMPSSKEVDWFSVAQRVGKSEWSRVKLMFFHPNGELYVTTQDGEMFKGPQPDNEDLSWQKSQATKLADRVWNVYDALSMDPNGVLYGVTSDGKLYKGEAPTDEKSSWETSRTLVGGSEWNRLTHFMAFTPDGNMWCIDKYNGNIYKGYAPTPEDPAYLLNAELLGWGYHEFRFFAFTKDKTISVILSFEFLPDQGEKVSENTKVLEEKLYDNRQGTTPLTQDYMCNKSVRDFSSFSLENGFTFQMGDKVTFNMGIPFISEGAVKINTSSTRDWIFAKTKETMTYFQSSTNVEVPPGKAIRVVASVTKAVMNIPFKGKARTMYGTEVDITGMWEGSSHYNLGLNQKD
ncbi:tachylectin-2-like [Dendropsophus ebraccatus]|uniref:tachylectin-2-like n=1 Tax=Dendropsophus ebraccatus TaxID=150705 RepID=UPI003831B66A